MRGSFFARQILLSCAAILPSVPAFAAQVRGTVDAGSTTEAYSMLGYARTRVASRAASIEQASKVDAAVFLAARESGVIPAPSEPYKVVLANLELSPSVSACVIDGKVSFTNEDRALITLEIEGKEVAKIGPRDTFVYDCKVGEPKTRRVRVKEWPHVRASLFVGEVGVIAAVGANGSFSLQAPQGKYELQVITEEGLLDRRPVEVKAADVDVGKIVGAAAQTDATQEKTIEAVPAKEQPVQPAAPKKEPVAPVVKKDPAAPVVKKDPATKEKIPAPVLPVMKKKDAAKPAEEASEELDFGEQ